MKIKFLAGIIISLFIYTSAQTQDTIYLKNPSFEATKDKRKKLRIPDWLDLNMDENSPPNFHSSKANFFKVKQDPSEGRYYISMVTRYDSTWESILQLLDSPLKKNVDYSFAIDLCTSNDMKSATKRSTKVARTKGARVLAETFDNGAIFRIQGSHTTSGANEVLVESQLIEHEDWKRYTFEFTPNEEYDLFMLEVFFDIGREGLPFVNGNVLLDNCGPIIRQSLSNN